MSLNAGSNVSLGILNVAVCKRYEFFRIFLAAIIPENSTNESFQPDRMARKASDVSAADWRYQTHVNNYRDSSHVLLRLFSGLEILEKHRTLFDKQWLQNSFTLTF